MYYMMILYAAHWHDVHYRYNKRKFLLYTRPYCNICGKYCKRLDRTVDHIIPKAVCYDYEMWGLIIDPRNFQMLCSKCNRIKDDSTLFIPLSVRQAIKKREYKPVVTVHLKFSI